jgi:hypothetical protein
MKPHYKPLATTLAATLQLAVLAAVPVAWTNSPGMPPYPIKPVPHGSTVDLAVTLKGYTTPPIADGADVRLWYQTNGMGSAWWSAPATFDGSTITATFGPAQDCGADRVSLFFGAPSNVFASAVLRLTHAPGFSPSSLPFPVPALDFATVELRNLSALTNGWSFGSTIDLTDSTNYTDSALGAFAATGTVARAATYGTPTRWTDASGCVWKVEPFPASITLERFGETAEYQYIGLFGAVCKWGPDAVHDYISFDDTMDEWIYYNDQSGVWLGTHEIVNGEQTVELHSPFAPSSVVQISFTSHFGETNLVGRVAYTNDIPDETDPTVPEWAKEPAPPSYSAADVGAAPAAIVPVLTSVSNDAATAKLNAETALRIVLGESVWFAVTNYMRTVEGVIPSLQLWEVRGSATNLVYDSREEITNTVRVLTSELRAELEARIPSKAWGNYQSDGTDNPQPGEVAIINPPTIILTGGGTFNKYIEVGDSSVWVLQSSGSVSFGGDTNGNFFAVHDDEGNTHFKVAKTDSYDLPMFISDILPRQSQNHILIYTATTNRQGNAVAQPVLFAANDLKNSTWHEEVEGEIDALGITVSWAKDETIPAWVATITPDVWCEKMFFRAKVTQEGGVAVINTAPVRFDGGVQIGNGTYRLVPYTTGGKTYLTVEGMP